MGSISPPALRRFAVLRDELGARSARFARFTTQRGKLFAAGAALFLFPFLAAAECTITVTSDPAMPVANLVKNPGFERGSQPWDLFSLTLKDGVISTEAHSGRHSFKLVGQKGVNKGIRQGRLGPQEFKPPIPAGTPITISAWCKTVGTDPEGGACGLSATVTYSDGTDSYIAAPSFPKVAHDWAKVTTVQVLKKDMKWFDQVYGALYYDQTGEAYFDDIFAAIGKLKLSYKVACPGIKSVRLYSEEQGLLKDSGVLAKDTHVSEGSLESPILLDRFVVQVEDNAGNLYSERYPKNDEPAFPKIADGETRIFERFPRETLQAGALETYSVTLPAAPTGKTVSLQLMARGQSDNIAGCSAILQIQVNGKDVTIDSLMERKTRYTFADGRDNPTAQGNKVFYLYYSPDFFPIDSQNPYYPTDLPRNDPYTFKFNVTGLVKEGKNVITLQHAGTPGKVSAMVVEDAKLVIR